MSDDPLALMAELRRESFRSAGLDWTVELFPQQWSRLHAAIDGALNSMREAEARADLATEREQRLVEALKTAKGLIEEFELDGEFWGEIADINAALATHEHNEGES